MEPDFQGFEQASVTLREQFGRDVVFLTPTATTWPEGTPIDPQTGEPYDPAVQPLASGWASAAVNALVVTPNANRLRDDVVNSAIGEIGEGEAAMVVGASASAVMKDATRVVDFDGTYEITERADDAIAGSEPDRIIVRVKQRGRKTTP